MKKLHKWFIKWIMKKYGYTIHQCSCKGDIEKPKILLTTQLFYETNRLFIDALIKTKTVKHYFDPNIVIHGVGGYICDPKIFDLKFKPLKMPKLNIKSDGSLMAVSNFLDFEFTSGYMIGIET